MRRYSIVVTVLGLSFGFLTAVTNVLAGGGDRSEASSCSACHINPDMAYVVGKWEIGNHANSYDSSSGNTFCASCHSPLLADPDATYSDNEPIPLEDWQDVTCSSCHPPYELRVQWYTPIGIYNIETNDWTPVYDSNQLCMSCHSGPRYGKDFKASGQSMFEQKGVKCADCHMAAQPSPVSANDIQTHDVSILDNLPFSCGVEGTGCHSNKTLEWAIKQVEKDKIHGDKDKE